MKSEFKTMSDSLPITKVVLEKISAVSTLFKLRLSLLVVFSSILGAVIVGGLSSLSLVDFFMLGTGGLLVSGSASGLNQWFEKDFDKLMKRTRERPLVTGMLSTPFALIIIGLSAIAGLLLLYQVHPRAAYLSALAWVLYAFVYTPMKRLSPFAVFIGAFPGAIPILVGTVAVQGEVTFIAFLLFSVQFIWQFPHFWAIAWLSDADYKKAGFYLLPSINSKKDASAAWQCVVYSLLLIPLTGVLLFNGYLNGFGFLIINLINLVYIYYAWRLYRTLNDKAARKLMFYSFAYLPLVLFGFSFLISV
jgi:protoheme IX farnesyltransferase